MNSHTKRLLARVANSINLYEQGKIDENGLMQDIAGIGGAIEEKEIQSILSNFEVKIEETLYLYDVDEGKAVLKEEIKKIKTAFSGLV